MKKIFCFIDRQESLNGELKAFLEELDSSGNEIYLYFDIDDELNDPGVIFEEIGQAVFIDHKSPLMFITNMESLLLVIYRLYQQTFNEFVYYNQPEAQNYQLYGIYQRIASLPVEEKELLYLPVYTNTTELMIGCHSLETRDYQILLNETLDNVKTQLQMVRKYYLIEDCYYLFEPVLTDKKLVINNKSQENNTFRFPGFSKMCYMLNTDSELLNELFEYIDHLSGENIIHLYDVFDRLAEKIKGYSKFEYAMVCSIIDDAAQLDDGKSIIRSIALYSFLMKVTKKAYYFNKLLEITAENEYLDCLNKYYVFNQCKRYLFTNEVGTDHNTDLLMKKLYTVAFEGFKEVYAKELVQIPKEERDEDTVMVFTIQFLIERHPPTKTTLERCYTLGKLLGKKIILISTREQHSEAGALVMYNASVGNVNEEYNDKNSYPYKDLEIPFYQPGVEMPNKDVIREILHEVRRIKPSFIFSIGNGSITADLCGQIVPEIASSVVFSSLPTTAGAFSLIGRTISDAEWSHLISMGYSKDNIIESTFTFELRPKTNKATRESLHIPNNCFVLVTVGNRLEMDVSEEFIELIQRTFEQGTFIVFAGMFDTYEEYCRKYPLLKEHSIHLGYYNDILALMENCDLYVNPIRSGGGFSIVEAFHEGKPGVTVRVGDVATAAGEEFCVNNYNEMEEVILRYMKDKDFYHRMAELAKNREKVLTDSKASMINIIEKVKSSRLFF